MMMQTIINKINEKHDLTFNAKTHTYYANNEELDNVTTYLQTIFPFNKEKISKAVAQKTGKTQKTILKQWEKQTRHGTKTHNLIQKHLQRNNLSIKEKKEIANAINFFKENENWEIKAIEAKIFSKQHKIAGTVDLILKNTENNKYYLADWKTSKKTIQKNKAYKKAKKPFHYLPSNKFHKFSMQLSLYQAILQHQYDISIYDTFVIHLKRDKTYEVIDTMTLIYEANQILKNKEK